MQRNLWKFLESARIYRKRSGNIVSLQTKQCRQNREKKVLNKDFDDATSFSTRVYILSRIKFLAREPALTPLLIGI